MQYGDIESVIAVLESPTKETIRALLDDDTTVFWIDWRQEDETIADSCEMVLGTGHLSGELVEVDSAEGMRSTSSTETSELRSH